MMGRPRDGVGKYSIVEDSIDKYKKICPNCQKETNEKNIDKYAMCHDCYMHEKFNIFWNKYPKRVGKEKAQKAFFKICLDDVVFSKILDSLDKFKKTSDWQKNKGQYIPYPASWINQKRWEDEFDVDIQSNTKSISNPIDPEIEARFNMKVSEIYE